MLAYAITIRAAGSLRRVSCTSSFCRSFRKVTAAPAYTDVNIAGPVVTFQQQVQQTERRCGFNIRKAKGSTRCPAQRSGTLFRRHLSGSRQTSGRLFFERDFTMRPQGAQFAHMCRQGADFATINDCAAKALHFRQTYARPHPE